MKKLLLVVLLLVSSMLIAQVELKGYTIGDKYMGDLEVLDGNVIIHSSLGGVDGALILSVLNDKTIHSIFFIPAEGDKPVRIYKTDVDRILSGIESKFNIKLKKRNKDYGDDYSYYVKSNGYVYILAVEHNQFMSPSSKLTLSIGSIKLDKIAEKEAQLKVNKDF